MQDNINPFNPPKMVGERRQPIALVAQFMQSMVNMQHIDEVFLWLAAAIGQSVDIPVVQFFANQVDPAGQFRAEVRALSTQNPSIPQQVYTNRQMTAVVERLFLERRSVASLPVERLFSASHVALFTQYKLLYWSGYFLQNDSFLPSARTAFATTKIPTPFNMIVSLFTPLPLTPEQVRAVSFILDQSLRLIVNRGLLIPPTSLPAATNDQKLDISLALSQLIPRRSQNVEQFQADNPFANAAIISDKNARRFYTAIDGSKNVADLNQILHLDPKDLIEVLQYLVQQKRIVFYTSEGELVKNSPFDSPFSPL